MKKYRIISFLLIVSFVLTLSVVASSDGVVFKILSPSEMPKAGETFEVAVEISNNRGFSAIQFTLAYDKTELNCEKVKAEGVLKEAMTVTNPDKKDGAIVAAASLDSLVGDGVIAKYSFTAKEDISDFGFKLKDIVLTDANKKDIEYEVNGSEKEEVKPPVESPDNEKPTNRPSGDKDITEDKEDEIEPALPEEKPEADDKENNGVMEIAFPDVFGHWAESFIGEAVKLGLFKGDTEGNFNPDDNITRAQFVTVLWRMAGKPEVSIELPFRDIENQIPEFKEAIAWGYANGYINGVSEFAFDPDGTLTREAGMKILHFYSGGNIGMEMQLYSIYDSSFEDSAQISPWAKSSVYWGFYNKLISGTSTTTLSPQGVATRAQLAKILVNYINTYSK